MNERHDKPPDNPDPPEQGTIRPLGLLKGEFSEAELASLAKALAEPLSDEEIALWYDAPLFPPHSKSESDRSLL